MHRAEEGVTGLYEVGLLMVGFGFGSLFQWVKERINNALDNSTPRSTPQAMSEGQPACTCGQPQTEGEETWCPMHWPHTYRWEDNQSQPKSEVK